jgi:hypothetical protein
MTLANVNLFSDQQNLFDHGIFRPKRTNWTYIFWTANEEL